MNATAGDTCSESLGKTDRKWK